jgi:hypothetical protein
MDSRIDWLRIRSIALAALCLALPPDLGAADPPARSPRIGYTELRTNLAGGRHANVRTMRAMIVNADGSESRAVAEELADDPNAWTQFAGWSPDGATAVVGRGWQSPANAKWEEEHKTFREPESRARRERYTTRPPGRCHRASTAFPIRRAHTSA